LRHRNEHEGEQKEIERVQGPAEKAGEKRFSLNGIKRFEKADRFHVSDVIVGLAIEKSGV
jgi:hypothetical protein